MQRTAKDLLHHADEFRNPNLSVSVVLVSHKVNFFYVVRSALAVYCTSHDVDILIVEASDWIRHLGFCSPKTGQLIKR